MNIQPCNNYNNSFGSTVIMTSGANKIIRKYKPNEKKFLMQQITGLEQNGVNNVVVIDACHKVDDIFMTCYMMIRDKVYQGKYPNRLYDKNKIAFQATYNTAACNMEPVKINSFDKYNPLWDIIKNSCKVK